MVELLTCPFCGSEAEISQTYRYTWVVGCANDDCPCWCGTEFDTKEEAVNFWNTRAPEKEVRYAKWKPHYYISKAHLQLGGNIEDGWTCSYCGKHSYVRKEICDGCDSIMYEKVIR